MEWTAESLLQFSGSTWGVCTLHAALKLGLFDELHSGARTAAELAETLSMDVRATGMLLRAVAALGFLEFSNGQYQLTGFSRERLRRESPRTMVPMLLHHHYLIPGWVHLDEAVRTGSPVRKQSGPPDEAQLSAFLLGMHVNSTIAAEKMAPLIDLSGCRHLLDLGGGPGTWAIHFCLKYPELRATVADLPATRPYAEKTIAEAGLTDRIDFSDIDFVKEEIGGRYDAAWLSHVLHSSGPDTCRDVIRKTYQSLNPGGRLLIHEFILDDSGCGPVFPALFALNMLTGTQEGQSYTQGQLFDMLTGAGLEEIERLTLPAGIPSGIVLGRKKTP